MTDKEKHTPGPWVYNEHTQSVYSVGPRHGVKSHEMHVADVRGHGYLTGQGGGAAMSGDQGAAIQDANGKLIAAAPDLFTACKALLMACVMGDANANPDPIELCRAALNKAEGYKAPADSDRKGGLKA